MKKLLYKLFKRPVFESHPEVKRFGFDCDYDLLDEFREEMEMREIIFQYRSNFMDRMPDQERAEKILDKIVGDLAIPSRGNHLEQENAYRTLDDLIKMGMYSEKCQRKLNGEIIADGIVEYDFCKDDNDNGDNFMGVLF